MKNKFCIESITVRESKISYTYSISGEWTIFFDKKRKCEIEYYMNMTEVPKSVLAVPLIGNILPIAWLCDAQIFVETLDMDFYNNILNIKKGYEQMYPMFRFLGKIDTKAVLNRPPISEKKSGSGCFFSGGVDAYTTLFRHLDENPCLITIWGADIKLSDEPGWEYVKSHVSSIAQKFCLDHTFIKSDFRLIINERALDRLVKRSGDGWWHGFQSGVAVLSHAAPVAFINGIKKIYIASSFPETMKGKYTCASDPSIDNNVRFCGCNILHDGYEMERQDKIKYLIDQVNSREESIKFRVCWEVPGGENCCRCEKCYRTILEIVSECADPNEFGFIWNDESIRHCRKALKHEIVLPQYNWDQFYPLIQKRIRDNQEHIMDIDKYKWLLEMDFTNINNRISKRIYSSFLIRGIRKIGKSIKMRGKKCK